MARHGVAADRASLPYFSRIWKTRCWDDVPAVNTQEAISLALVSKGFKEIGDTGKQTLLGSMHSMDCFFDLFSF